MTDAPSDLIQTTEALSRLDNDVELYVDLVQTYLENNECLPATLRELEEKDGRPEAIHRVHQLKGAALTLGALPLSALCAEVERALKAGNAALADSLLPELHKICVKTAAEFTRISAQLKKPL